MRKLAWTIEGPTFPHVTLINKNMFRDTSPVSPFYFVTFLTSLGTWYSLSQSDF